MLLRGAFPLLLPGDELGAAAEGDLAIAPAAAGEALSAEGRFETAAGKGLPGDAAFAEKVLAGRWRSAYGVSVEVRGQPPQLECLYGAAPGRAGEEKRALIWEHDRWSMKTPAGHFALVAACEQSLEWHELGCGWSTQWVRA